MDGKRKDPHQDIDEIVKEYQQGNEFAGEELLRIFGCHPQESLSKYIGKYYDLLRYGKMDFGNKDLRRFVSLFIADSKTRNDLIPFYQYSETKSEVMKIVNMLNEKFECIEDEDLVQDLRLLLLGQAKRYEKRGSKTNFLGYLYNSYRYAIKNYYSFLFEDMLFSERVDYEVDPENEEENEGIEIEDAWFFEDVYFENEKEELGFNWIHNRTATYPFNQLSTYERTVLFLSYEKNMTDKDVSAVTGYHEDTIFVHRKKIKKKLNELLIHGEDNEYV